MTAVVTIPIADWDPQCTPAVQEHAMHMLEAGNVLFFPRLGFALDEIERRFLSPHVAGRSKNVSFDVSTGKLRGAEVDETETGLLRAMMRRFAVASGRLLVHLFPLYGAGLVHARTSFRPVEIAGRPSTWRKDDTRLHVDSFPSSPVQDKRILRVFSNVDPQGRTRTWRIGESFESVARRRLPGLSGPVWGSSGLLRLCGITRSRRSRYDHFMLQLHDRLKSDSEYQSRAEHSVHEFPAGSTWVAFTDQVLHAAMAGQYALEQTFYLPVSSMRDPSQSPLRILERSMGRTLT